MSGIIGSDNNNFSNYNQLQSNAQKAEQRYLDACRDLRQLEAALRKALSDIEKGSIFTRKKPMQEKVGILRRQIRMQKEDCERLKEEWYRQEKAVKEYKKQNP